MAERELFQIGEVARMYHLSVGTLRHYERIGLWFAVFQCGVCDCLSMAEEKPEGAAAWRNVSCFRSAKWPGCIM